MTESEVRKAISALRAARLLLQKGFTDEAVSSSDYAMLLPYSQGYADRGQRFASKNARRLDRGLLGTLCEVGAAFQISGTVFE